jgi:hypothetical protein
VAPRRIVIIDPGSHPFLLRQPGKLIVIYVGPHAAVLTPVAVELLGGLVGVIGLLGFIRLVCVKLCHLASSGSRNGYIAG